jgi:hypothetical protein
MFFFACLESVSVREAPTGLPLESVPVSTGGSARCQPQKSLKNTQHSGPKDTGQAGL